MTEKDLNIKYICEKTLLDKQDKLIPIILEMIKESYKSGLNQAEYDNAMGLVEENEELKKQLKIKDDGFKTVDEELCEYAEENEELKKQLSDREERLIRLRNNAEKHARRELFLEEQQKEFIKYLDDELIEIEEDIGNSITKEYKKNYINRKHIYQTILAKYNEIIGGENE